ADLIDLTRQAGDAFPGIVPHATGPDTDPGTGTSRLSMRRQPSATRAPTSRAVPSARLGSLTRISVFEPCGRVRTNVVAPLNSTAVTVALILFSHVPR